MKVTCEIRDGPHTDLLVCANAGMILAPALCRTTICFSKEAIVLHLAEEVTTRPENTAAGYKPLVKEEQQREGVRLRSFLLNR